MQRATKGFTPRKMTIIALLVAGGTAIGYFEGMLPMLIPALPGAKLGLANVFSLFALVSLGPLSAFTVVVLRCLLSSALWGSPISFIYSVVGGLLAMSVMYLLNRGVGDKLSLYGVSVAGALFHNVGQVLVASLILNNAAVFSYLPLLCVVAIPTGLFVGLVTKLLVGALSRSGIGG